MNRNLSILLRMLNASHINAAAHITADGRVQVWLGDPDAGLCDVAFFPFEELQEAADWLSARALHYFPCSDYARVHRFIGSALGASAAVTALLRPPRPRRRNVRRARRIADGSGS